MDFRKRGFCRVFFISRHCRQNGHRLCKCTRQRDGSQTACPCRGECDVDTQRKPFADDRFLFGKCRSFLCGYFRVSCQCRSRLLYRCADWCRHGKRTCFFPSESMLYRRFDVRSFGVQRRFSSVRTHSFTRDGCTQKSVLSRVFQVLQKRRQTPDYRCTAHIRRNRMHRNQPIPRQKDHADRRRCGSVLCTVLQTGLYDRRLLQLQLSLPPHAPTPQCFLLPLPLLPT